MGRSRGKGKKQTSVFACNDNDPVNVEQDKVLAYTSKRRGRPQKGLKNEMIEEEDHELILETDDLMNSKKSSITTKNSDDQSVLENGIKRRKNSSSQITKNSNIIKDENDSEGKSDAEKNSVIKSVGFRQIGSRRKNTPRRAAEVGVECK